ncbi:hypothetical protein ACFWUQ_20165 [Streptomyces sp. NPDC058662]|uniref:hypothetical protein n=1 Tax=Streptomyces sp. NPDC058662 TaxID=3346583 RepID=UPI0036480A29
MGLKDQFQDKAKRLAEQAEPPAPNAEDKAPQRSAPVPQDVRARARKARETFDDHFEK